MTKTLSTPDPTKYDCERCEAIACMHRFGGADVHIPDCEADNSFKAKQCWKDKCWCVKKDGTKIPDTEKDAETELDCEAERSKWKGKKKISLPG